MLLKRPDSVIFVFIIRLAWSFVYNINLTLIAVSLYTVLVSRMSFSLTLDSKTSRTNMLHMPFKERFSVSFNSEATPWNNMLDLSLGRHGVCFCTSVGMEFGYSQA